MGDPKSIGKIAKTECRFMELRSREGRIRKIMEGNKTDDPVEDEDQLEPGQNTPVGDIEEIEDVEMSPEQEKEKDNSSKETSRPVELSPSTQGTDTPAVAGNKCCRLHLHFRLAFCKSRPKPLGL